MNNRQKQLIRLKTGIKEAPEVLSIPPPENSKTKVTGKATVSDNSQPIGLLQGFRISDRNFDIVDVFTINSEEIINLSVQDSGRVDRYQTLGGGPVHFLPGIVTTTVRLSLSRFNPLLQIGSRVRVNATGLENRTLYVTEINRTISAESLTDLTTISLSS